MNPPQKRPELSTFVSALAIIPIAGLVGGLLIGLVLARIGTSDELTILKVVAKFGIAGFFFACLLILAGACIRRSAFRSVRGMIGLVAVLGVLAWFVIRVLFAVLG